MDIFYARPDNINGKEIILDEFERRHVLQAMRKTSGDEIFVTDGQGHLFKTAIASIKPLLNLKIKNKRKIQRPAITLYLAVGFIKANRLDFLIEKGTELGVSAFHLIRSRYANYSSANLTRFIKITRQAIKQSRQFYLPEIFLHQDLISFIGRSQNFSLKLAAIDSRYPKLLKRLDAINLEISPKICLMVGPEGGFCAEEVETIVKNGFFGVSLGRNRLRTETAAISGISVIQQYMQN